MQGLKIIVSINYLCINNKMDKLLKQNTHKLVNKRM